MREALREAGLLLVVAAGLGFIYTAATEKGVFSRPSALKTWTVRPGQAPLMTSNQEAWSLYQGGKAIFVDARHEFDFKLGHIKGAVNIPLKDFESKKAALDTIPKDKLIVAYCDGAECNSSIELSVKLAMNGFRNVRIFFDGWRDWTAMNLPTEKSP